MTLLKFLHDFYCKTFSQTIFLQILSTPLKTLFNNFKPTPAHKNISFLPNWLLYNSKTLTSQNKLNLLNLKYSMNKNWSNFEHFSEFFSIKIIKLHKGEPPAYAIDSILSGKILLNGISSYFHNEAMREEEKI